MMLKGPRVHKGKQPALLTEAFIKVSQENTKGVTLKTGKSYPCNQDGMSPDQSNWSCDTLRKDCCDVKNLTRRKLKSDRMATRAERVASLNGQQNVHPTRSHAAK